MTASFPYESVVEPEAVDIDRGKLERVTRAFRKQLASGSFPGGQLVLRRRGKLVLNIACGIARGFRPEEDIPAITVKPDTPFPVFSAGKPLAAMVVAILEDRGLIDVEAPIARIFPEFARQGKENITTLDVLTHRAGLLMPELIRRPELWDDRDAVLRHLIDTRPTYERGTFAYMPYEFGWVLAEICERATGRTLPTFFAEEIARPLNLHALSYGLAGRTLDSVAFSYWLGKEKVMVAGVNVAENFDEVHNCARFFDALNPADSMVTDAAHLAAFYEFLLNGGVTPAGTRLISEEALRKYTARKLFGRDRSLRTFLNVGRGFILGGRFPSPFGWWNTGGCFGHGGGFSSLAFGDYHTGIAAAIITNGNKGFNDYATRFIPLAHRLRKACSC